MFYLETRDTENGTLNGIKIEVFNIVLEMKYKNIIIYYNHTIESN